MDRCCLLSSSSCYAAPLTLSLPPAGAMRQQSSLLDGVGHTRPLIPSLTCSFPDLLLQVSRA